jgi:hypothetical protein
MTKGKIAVDDGAEALFVEQALAVFRELRQTAKDAPDGEVLHQAEMVAVRQGRELIRRGLESVIQDQAEEVEKKNAPTRTCSCGGVRAHRGRKGKTFLTAAGPIRLSRVYFVCRKCRTGIYPLDFRAGIQGYASRQARRLMCLAGASWSFDKASEHLQELCGLKVSDNTIRKACHNEASQMASWQRESAEAHVPFRSAQGDIEFSTDGTSVNTTDGWREMRVGIFSKREPGEPADASNWGDRHLPAPHVRLSFAAVETADRFRSRWGRWATRLGIADTSEISVLGDGAPWIWEGASMHFAGHDGVLDIFHALEHVAEAGKGLFDKKPVELEQWHDQARNALLEGGWPAMFDLLQTTKKNVSRGRWEKYGRPLQGYLGRRKDQLDYPRRLATGQSIGSGQVEGACKHMIGRRLKQTGARWRVRRVNRMAYLCALFHADQWKTYWDYAT